jgi:hypothetical protein
LLRDPRAARIPGDVAVQNPSQPRRDKLSIRAVVELVSL